MHRGGQGGGMCMERVCMKLLYGEMKVSVHRLHNTIITCD